MNELLTGTNIKVNVVTGHLDAMNPTQATEKWVNELKWAKKVEQTLETILVRDQHHGYRRTLNRLTVYSIWRSGRAIPLQNPEALMSIMKNITRSDRT